MFSIDIFNTFSTAIFVFVVICYIWALLHNAKKIGSLYVGSLLKGILIVIIAICFYMLISFSLSLLVSRKHKDYGLLLYLIYGFFIIQFSYGYGYIKGILNFYILNKTNKIKTINLSR